MLAMRTFATPGFIEALKSCGIGSVELFGPAVTAHALLLKGEEPSWVIGDPAVPSGSSVGEDEGRTLKIPAPFRFYGIRDRHPAPCGCGCGGGGAITFLLPSEY